MTKEEKQFLMPSMIKFYNENLAKDMRIWSKRYHQALKEIWKYPINMSSQKDEKILEKHKLGSISQSYCHYANCKPSKFEWNWELLELDKKYRKALRFNFS